MTSTMLSIRVALKHGKGNVVEAEDFELEFSAETTVKDLLKKLAASLT